VPEGGDEGADQELTCVNVAQDLDPSPEGPKDELIACQILIELVGTIRNGNQLEPVLKD
jgi:hypothetical protein